MALPTPIVYLGQEYNVVEESAHTASEGVLGEIDFLTLDIYIHEHLSDGVKKETLFHECMHIVDKMFQLELEESQLKRMSYAVFGMLRDTKLKELFVDAERESTT